MHFQPNSYAHEFYWYFQVEDNLQMLRLFTERQSCMLKDFGEQLESSICKLKNDVALIVKKKRESIAYSKH